jgi:hypothetical protein
MLAQTHDSGSNNNTLAEAMQVRLSKYSDDHLETFEWNHENHRVRCVCHKLALMVNAGLQGLGIKAPPPPLVKSTMLGDFPIPTNTLQSIPEEDEAADSEEATSKTDDEGELDPEVDDTDLKASEAEDSSQWYDVVDGPHPEPDVALEDVETTASGRNNANAVHDLITKVSFI